MNHWFDSRDYMVVLVLLLNVFKYSHLALQSRFYKIFNKFNGNLSKFCPVGWAILQFLCLIYRIENHDITIHHGFYKILWIDYSIRVFRSFH